MQAAVIGNFDGVHRGHQAMLALLRGEAAQRGVGSCVLTFEPHPRDFFASRSGQQQAAPARVGTLRDKLTDLAQCGVDQAVVLPFDSRAAVHYGSIRATLEREGTPIGPMDLLIAAHARALQMTVVTHNVREFLRVPDLVVDDWAL